MPSDSALEGDTVSALSVHAARSVTETLPIKQVNTYQYAVTTLVWGGSAEEKNLGNGMAFTYWDAIVVESVNGTLYVSQIITDDVPKSDVKATTDDGFVLLLYNTDVDVTVGDVVTVSFDYKQTTGYAASGYGTAVFSDPSAPIQAKPVKDNTEKLDTVEGASTREFITVNLYDYGTNINEKYEQNKNYPGFQQEGGQKTVSSAANSNFGNNITADLAAGDQGVTKNGTAVGINQVPNANRALSGVMRATLGEDGYPALQDGTSLKYLFSGDEKDSTGTPYAVKQNQRSVDGLFQYNETTGSYHYNSRENHAQFNSENDTFTLYRQVITPNFTMYPFGNFLPFNDITNLSQQTSRIDRAYLREIADSAAYKGVSGQGEAYSTLASALNGWIGQMDASYGTDWTAENGVNSYFAGAGLSKRFTDNELSDLYTLDYDEPTDFYFGMEMSMNFMQPKNGLTGKDGRQPMVYEFAGDDDVWVYIDGVLFLDLSGIHRHVGGKIDFVNGTVSYYALDPATGDVGTTPYETKSFAEILANAGRATDTLNSQGTFPNYSHHTLNFYYMERGSGSGVCRMNFNFPLLRENSISVTKELSVEGGASAELLGRPDFHFQVLKADGSGLFIGAGKPYEILDTAGNRVGNGVTDEHGVFTIKEDQTAVFSKIKEDAGRYFVRELLDPALEAQYGSIVVDGTSVTKDNNVQVGSDTFTGVDSPAKNVSDGSTVFCFNNRVTLKELGSLEISKTLTADAGGSDQTFQLEVTLDGVPLPVGTAYTVGDETRTVSRAGVIELKPNETARIPSILAGSAFTVRETAASAVGYSVTYAVNGTAQSGDQAAGTLDKASSVVKIAVHNSERAAEARIPVTKYLESPDGKAHSYTVALTRVTDRTGETAAEPAVTRELTLSVTDTPGTGAFSLTYPKTAVEDLPARFYYRVEERTVETERDTLFDTAVYVAEVTVSETDGKLTAAVTHIWKDSEEAETIAFTNRLNQYELPSTGGPGTGVFLGTGGLLVLAAGDLLRRRRRCA